ncbi:hypothetical protein Tco_0516647 [Tanacetum coccineum]
MCACVVLCLLVANCSQEHFECNALDPWITALEQEEATIKGEDGEKESKEQDAHGSGEKANITSYYRSKRAIAYMGEEKLCKDHKVKAMFKLHQITRPRLRRKLHQRRSSSSLHL